MLPDDALEALGLDGGASAAEIKEAYRDLVKVWHPDRFGSAVRLRRKSEEKLQQINDAYRVLQAHSGPVYVSKPVGRHRSPDHPGRFRHRSWTVSKKDLLVRVLAGFGLAMAVATVFVAFYSRRQSEARHRVVPDAQSQQPITSNSDVAPRSELNAIPGKANRHNRPSAPSFQVRQLTDAEAERVQSACGATQQHDPAKYQDCVSAQLGSAAPDMSALSAADRAGIQSACRKTKSREGLSGYNRCLARMTKLLKEASK